MWRRVVEVAQRLDSEPFLDGLPVTPVEIAEVEVAAACVREEQRAVFPRPKLVESLERDRLQRNRASAEPRLRVLNPSVRIRPSDLDDTGRTIDVAVFEREQLRGSKPGRGRKHDHRPEGRPEPLGDRPDLLPGLERSLLPAAPAGIGHTLRGVVVDQLPGDRSVQHLPQGLRRFEPMSFGNREPPREDLLRRELRKTYFAQRGGRLPEQPAELRDRDAFTLMRVQVLSDPFASVRVPARPPGKSRASLF